MAFTYDPDQASYTNLNWLRCLVGDTDSTYPLFTDAELNAIITKCTTDAVVDFDHAVGILFEVLGIDAVRLVESRKACSGAIALIDEMDMYAKRSEVYLD